MMTKSLPLTTDASIPVLGFGTWQLTGEECVRGVEAALRMGYCHIDTADAYGNHTEVAEGIKGSGVARKDIFITTKVWNTMHKRDDVIESGERFLKELNTDYIDLLLIHWPVRKVPVAETLKAMDELKRRGIIRAIGVSNFTQHHLEDALAAGVEITNNQVEAHPTFNQNDLRTFCGSKDISVTAYSPLGHGGDLEVPLMLELAKKYSKTPAQIALNWVMSRGMVVIPKSSNPLRIKENFDSMSFELEEDDLERIDVMPQGERIADPPFGEFNY